MIREIFMYQFKDGPINPGLPYPLQEGPDKIWEEIMYPYTKNMSKWQPANGKL